MPLQMIGAAWRRTWKDILLRVVVFCLALLIVLFPIPTFLWDSGLWPSSRTRSRMVDISAAYQRTALVGLWPISSQDRLRGRCYDLIDIDLGVNRLLDHTSDRDHDCLDANLAGLRAGRPLTFGERTCAIVVHGSRMWTQGEVWAQCDNDDPISLPPVSANFTARKLVGQS